MKNKIIQQKDLSYSVSSLGKQYGVQIDFRPAFQLQPLPDPPEDSVYELSAVDFDSGNANFTRITFSFRKPSRIPTTGAVPEDEQPPRIFLLEDSRQTQLTIRLPNTLAKKELEKLQYSVQIEVFLPLHKYLTMNLQQQFDQRNKDHQQLV